MNNMYIPKLCSSVEFSHRLSKFEVCVARSELSHNQNTIQKPKCSSLAMTDD